MEQQRLTRLRLERRGSPEFPPLFIPPLSSRAIKYSKIPPMPSATPVTPRVTRISRPPPHSLSLSSHPFSWFSDSPGNTLLHFSAPCSAPLRHANRICQRDAVCLSVCLSVFILLLLSPRGFLYSRGGGGELYPSEGRGGMRQMSDDGRRCGRTLWTDGEPRGFRGISVAREAGEGSSLAWDT